MKESCNIYNHVSVEVSECSTCKQIRKVEVGVETYLLRNTFMLCYCLFNLKKKKLTLKKS